MLTISYLNAFFAGFISFLSPCILPIIPLYLCFLMGKSMNDLLHDIDKNKYIHIELILYSFIFVFGFSTVFILLGVSATFLGKILSNYFNIFTNIFGVIIIIMGMHFLGIFKISFLSIEKHFYYKNKVVNFLGVYLVGFSFAFGWTPCIGPILATILTIASQEESIYTGLILLAIYSAGLGIPFILSAFFLKIFLVFIKKFYRYFYIIQMIIGLFLVLTGVLFLI